MRDEPLKLQNVSLKLDAPLDGVSLSIDKSRIREVSLSVSMTRDTTTLDCGCLLFNDIGNVKTHCEESERLYKALTDKLEQMKRDKDFSVALLDTDEASAYFAHYASFVTDLILSSRYVGEVK